MRSVGVRELRQNLSRYLGYRETEVKDGASFAVTERGREVARLSPSGPEDSPLARLVVDRGATLPTEDLLAVTAHGSPAEGPSSAAVLEEIRSDRA